MNIIKELKEVMMLEKDAIDALISSINEEFTRAVQMIYDCKGKIILTGIGKSGIIAQKISATLVSTGTMSIFMHPAEGMHGDLGILKKGDIVVAVGKSGESDELIGILPSVKRLGAKIIAITANRKSTLSENSDIVLLTPIKREACSLNLAPTCSTTAALIVGDAIAVTLMKLRGFRQTDFALYHPGGRLGKRLILTVDDIMRKGDRNPVVKIDDSIKTMLCSITEKMSGAVSVVDKSGKLKGLITDYDIRKIIEQGQNIFDKTLSEIMNPAPIYVYKGTKAATALSLMEKGKRPFLLMPVVDRSKKVIGMIHIHDIIAQGL